MTGTDDRNGWLHICTHVYLLCMSIYRRLIVIGKYMEGKFIPVNRYGLSAVKLTIKIPL